jgi:hypothetical protein
MSSGMKLVGDLYVDEWRRDVAALELALLRQGVAERDAGRERCSRCRRTPLVGERVYLNDAGPVLCALCGSRSEGQRLQSRVVRGPNFGQAIRIIGRRA